MLKYFALVAALFAVLAIGASITPAAPPAPTPAPPAVTVPAGSSFLDDYARWLRTGDLPVEYPRNANPLEVIR